ncbi:hypothetical protein OAZ90_01140 [Pelagibacteraceae bacterium]|nr:hypothetical protein [Pelagibacteraceae bacterium]
MKYLSTRDDSLSRSFNDILYQGLSRDGGLYLPQSWPKIDLLSLKNIGGHNPIEPACYGCVVISGKYVDNWTNIYEDMVKAKSCIIVNTFEEIELKMRELLNNNFEIKKIQKNALEFSKGPFFEKEQLYQDIEVYIN